MLRLESEAGRTNVWHMRAVPLTEGDRIAARLDVPRPDWWVDDGPTLNGVRVSFGSEPNSVRSVDAIAKLSSISYFNSIERKQGTQQRDPNNPYIIVVNQGAGGAMPMRHGALERMLAGHLPLWDDVSAILLFDYRAPAIHQPFWQISLHINDAAKLPAPNALLNLMPRSKEISVDIYE
jgi:hypothetical protein